MSTPARDPAVHYGRSHDVLPPDDDAALADFFAEQHARLEVIRRNEIWDWLGGNVLSFSHPERLLRGVWTEIASMALLVLTILVAGFTHGPVLWSFAALTLACLVLGRWLRTQPLKQTAAHYRRAQVFPVAIFAHTTDRIGEAEVPVVHALVGLDVRTWKDLRELMAQAERLEALVDGRVEVPTALSAFVEERRNDLRSRRRDASRVPVPPELGLGRVQVLRDCCAPHWLPHGELDSRLLFVLADPERLGPERARVMFHQTWGTGARSLCERFPLGGVA
jgi:hypothetical protein